MSQFNLVDEPWIPVRWADGARGGVGIRDALLRSGEIEGIEDPSPLVVAGLHRLLLAVLYRALEGPTDIDQAQALFEVGLPADRISAYLEQWRDRFWLFDKEHPFYQVPDYEPREHNGQQQWKPWTSLAAEHNGDNSKVLFDHVDNTDAGSIPTGMAARWLVACQTFALGGGNSDFQYTKSGPSATALMALPLGLNLHDTLLFCLVPEPRQVLADDLPLWERPPDTLTALRNGVARAATGCVDLYTWRSRSIKLRCMGGGESVGELAFASGLGWASKDFVDPMLAYRIDKNRGKLPLQFGDRGLWRDFDSLLPDPARLAPQVIEHSAALTRVRRARAPRTVIVLGQANDKTKAARIKYWRMECFALPLAVAQDRDLRSEVRELLVTAEDCHRALWSACSSFARNVLRHRDGGPGERDSREFQRLVKSVVSRESASPTYWSTLEAEFHGILAELVLGRDSDEVRRIWTIAVRDALRDAWERHRTAVSTGGAWTIRALSKAEAPVLRKLEALTAEIVGLTPEPEVA